MLNVDEAAVDYVSAPRTYEECFRAYRDYVVALVRKNGIPDSDAEDVAHDILMRLYEKDFLSTFDPTLVFTHQGVDHKARFKSFLSKVVILYLKGKREKLQRQASREMLIMDAPYGTVDNSPHSEATTWGEMRAIPAASAEEQLLRIDDGEREIRACLYRHIINVSQRSKSDTCDLVKLFHEVMRQIDENGRWDVHELRAKFGVSSTAMHSWLWRLRENCSDALDVRLPPKRGARR